MNREQIIERYLIGAKNYNSLEVQQERILLILSLLRLICFTGGLVSIGYAFTGSSVAAIISSLLIIILFLWLLKLYLKHSFKREFFGNLAIINKKEADAVSGDFSTFEGGASYNDTGHDFSNDIDLFGDFSLFQYLNRTGTGFGRDILAGWLSDPYSLSNELIKRQETIRELSLNVKWRQEFLAISMKRPLEKSNINDLLIWMEESPEIHSSLFKKILIYLLPSAAVIALVLTSLALIHYSYFIFICLLNLLYVTIGLRKTNKIHKVLTKRYNYLFSIHDLLKIFEKQKFRSNYLIDIQARITGNEVSAVTSVKKLSRLIQSFDNRTNMLIGFVLNGLFLWDYHCIYRLEKWKSVYKNMFPVWLDMLGQVDAYISLGNYAYNNPDFVYPKKSDDNTVLAAKRLGHQLIDESKRVCNDFSMERFGTVCIISGANMAGKSTFLRTVAVNFIIGMAGAPVCASEMRFIPVKLFSSMRTTDSLSHNESYFYAELKRLKILKSRIEKGEPVMFILDEILKGTNSKDKSTGSKIFLKRLIELGGTGLIATHDTSLGEMEKDHPGLIINKCFEIEIIGESIRFDYILQNGITNKMNAAILMRQMGIAD